MIAAFRSWGFPVTPWSKSCRTIEEVFSAIDELELDLPETDDIPETELAQIADDLDYGEDDAFSDEDEDKEE